MRLPGTIFLVITCWTLLGCDRQSKEVVPVRQPSPKERLVGAATQIIICSFGDPDQPAHIANLTQAAVELEWTEWWEYQLFQQAATKMTVVSRRMNQTLTAREQKVLAEVTKKIGAKVSYGLAGPSGEVSGELELKDAEESARKATSIVDRLPLDLQEEYQSCFDSLLRTYQHLLIAARRGRSAEIRKAELVIDEVPVKQPLSVVTSPLQNGTARSAIIVDPRRIPPPAPREAPISSSQDGDERRRRYPHEVIFDVLFGVKEALIPDN